MFIQVPDDVVSLCRAPTAMTWNVRVMHVSLGFNIIIDSDDLATWWWTCVVRITICVDTWYCGSCYSASVVTCGGWRFSANWKKSYIKWIKIINLIVDLLVPDDVVSLCLAPTAMTWNVCVTHGMCHIAIDSDDLPDDELVFFGAPTVLPDNNVII